MILHRIVSSLLVCLLLTIVLEGALAFLLGVRSGRGQLIVLLANVITNPLLQCVLSAVSFFWTPAAYYYMLVPLELAALLTEGRIYQKMLPLKINPYLFSLLLNAGSYLLGTGILKLIK